MTSPKHTPPGFYSYKHLEGADRVYLDKLRVNLKHDLLTVTGLPIKLWQDVDEIQWGQEWKKAIDKGLAEAAFFIPVITPGYLYSDVCQEEFKKFAEFEKKQGRTDLILPLIYVRPDDFDDKEAKKKNEIIRLCLDRQYVNWEDLRGLGDEGQEYRTRLTTLSKRIRELLKTLPARSAAVVAPSPKKKSTSPNKTRVRRKGDDAVAPSSVPSELSPGQAAIGEVGAPAQRTLHVDRLGHPGTYQTISKALEAAQGGDRILVAPGHYSESIVLTKPVVIVGEGNLGEVTVSVKEANVVISTTPFGRLQNLTLRQNGGAKFFSVGVRAGSLEIDGCEVTSASLSCIGIQSGAEVRVRRTRVHGSPQGGIAFFGGANGVVEECDIYDNGSPGISLINSGDVTIRSNKIHDGRSTGIQVTEKAGGLIEDNEIFANKGPGVTINEAADATIRRNRIYNGKGMGISISQQGKGNIVENDIFGNALSGLAIYGASTPSISNNDIHDNKQTGLYFYEDGGGVVEQNRVLKNGNNGATLDRGARPQFRNNRFFENGSYGIRVMATGGGIFEGNTFEDNKAGDKHIDSAAQANVQWQD